MADEKPCATCGTCPTCGRRPAASAPSYPVYPGTYPYYQPPYIWSGTSTTTDKLPVTFTYTN